MPLDETIRIRPDYITVFATHPAYPLLALMQEQEAQLARVTAERDEWRAGFDSLALKKRRKK